MASFIFSCVAEKLEGVLSELLDRVHFSREDLFVFIDTEQFKIFLWLSPLTFSLIVLISGFMFTKLSLTPKITKIFTKISFQCFYGFILHLNI